MLYLLQALVLMPYSHEQNNTESEPDGELIKTNLLGLSSPWTCDVLYSVI